MTVGKVFTLISAFRRSESLSLSLSLSLGRIRASKDSRKRHRRDVSRRKTKWTLTDHGGVGQIEVVHNIDKLLHRLGQSGIESSLLGHAGDGSAVVIMRRIQPVISWQRKDLLVHGLVEGRG